MCGDHEKKKKNEFEPKMYKISGTLGMIYIDDIHSKKQILVQKSFNVQLFQFN